MASGSTRREFLKASGWMAASGALTASGAALPLAGGRAGVTPGEVAVWVTGGNQRFARGMPAKWRPRKGAADKTIVLEPEKNYQEILGFGAAFTDASCSMFNQLAPPAREQLFHELFHPSEMGLSVCRTCIGSSDYSTKAYSYDEGEPDPDLKRFSIEHDREYILPMLRQARGVNPDLFLFSSPWSPPGWMKAGGSMLGGSMRKKYLPNYAQYFLKFLQAYAADGVLVQAVTPQNEVDTDQDGRMPACVWAQEYEMEFVGKHLGPLLAQNNLSTKIWILDHNYNLWGRAVAELDDPDVRKYCNAIAFHGYVGKPEQMSKAHDAYPNVEMYWTEGGPDYTAPDYLTDWAQWGKTFTGVLRNWCRAITGWNLALDEQGRPNIGPFSCGGLVTIHSQTKEITRSGQYWAFAHFSRTIRRGAKRFESHSAAADLDHVAFENPGGQRVLVVTNAGPAREIELQLGRMACGVQLESASVTTFVWS
jgi:glucosylceramidase